MQYFNEKPKVAKRQSMKRKDEIQIKKDTVQFAFEIFIEFKLKQNLRASTLNQKLSTHNSLIKFHETREDRPFYLTDITTEFISDYV